MPVNEADRNRVVMTRLKLRHLRLIDAIVEAHTISGAAAALNVTQPAISKGLREVEEILGVPLFERHADGLVLTAYGRAMAARSKLIQSEVRYAVDEIGALSAGTSGLLTIGALLVSQPLLIPTALNLLRRRSVSANVRVVDGTQESLLAALRGGSLDFVVGRLARVEKTEPFAQQVLLREPLIVVAARKHPLARLRKLTPAALATAEWILPPRDSAAYGAIRRILDEQGVARPVNHIESVSYLTVRSLLIDGGMVAVLPRSVAQIDIDSGLLTALPVPIAQEPLPVGVTLRSDHPITPLVASALDCLREAADMLTAKKSRPTAGSSRHVL
jgi:DNA-binding transcriptional LysR family regulator